MNKRLLAVAVVLLLLTSCQSEPQKPFVLQCEFASSFRAGSPITSSENRIFSIDSKSGTIYVTDCSNGAVQRIENTNAQECAPANGGVYWIGNLETDSMDAEKIYFTSIDKMETKELYSLQQNERNSTHSLVYNGTYLFWYEVNHDSTGIVLCRLDPKTLIMEEMTAINSAFGFFPLPQISGGYYAYELNEGGQHHLYCRSIETNELEYDRECDGVPVSITFDGNVLAWIEYREDTGVAVANMNYVSLKDDSVVHSFPSKMGDICIMDDWILYCDDQLNLCATNIDSQETIIIEENVMPWFRPNYQEQTIAVQMYAENAGDPFVAGIITPVCK